MNDNRNAILCPLVALLLATACSPAQRNWRPCDCELLQGSRDVRLEIVSASQTPAKGLTPFTYNAEEWFVARDGPTLCSLDDVAGAAVMGDPEYAPFLVVWLTESAHRRALASAGAASHSRKIVGVKLDGRVVEVVAVERTSRALFLGLAPADRCAIACATQTPPGRAGPGT